MNLVFIVLADASIALQAVLLVSLLCRRQYRRYPLLLIYSLVFFAATLAEMVVWRAVGLGSPTYRYLYMTDEAVIDLLLFLMVIVMTYQAIGDNPVRAKVGRHIGRWLAVVMAGAVLLPLVLFQGPDLQSALVQPNQPDAQFWRRDHESGPMDRAAGEQKTGSPAARR